MRLLPAFLSVSLALGAASLAAPSPAPAAPGDPGLAGTPLVLATDVDLHEYDVVHTSDGTAYIGWISSPTSAADRQVHLCVLPAGAATCSGGMQSTTSGTGGASSAKGLRVLRTGDTVELVWFHDTPDSINGPDNARISSAAVVGGFLSGAVTETDAPSFGSMLTAEPGPGGLWTVTQALNGNGVRVRRGDGAAAETVPTPWRVGQARLAFDGSTPVLVFDKAGDIDEPLRVTRYADGVWKPSTRVPGTWALGGAWDVETARGAVHLVSSVDNASYRPQVAVWRGTAFGPHRPTGNRSSCSAATHDLVTDPSGRLADVARQCNDLAIANHPRRSTAATVRARFGGTPSGGVSPQISTLGSGLGRVVWSRSGATGDTLLTAPARLPALLTSASRRVRGGTATLRGPVSCLPVSRVRVGVSGRPARGWRVASRSLRLDGRPQGAVIDGRSLAPGSTHRLVGEVVFRDGGRRARARVTLTFTACPI